MSGKRILLVADAPGGLHRGVLQKIAHLAGSLGAEVEVLDCAFDPTLTEGAEIRAAIERRREELAVIARVLEESSVRARATVLWAYPAREGVIRQVRRSRPDLLVIGSRKRARLARALFTYSDYKLIETVPCPVLVIKNERPYDDGTRVIAAVDPMHTHDNPGILDERIVDLGTTLSQALGLPLHIFHACSLLPQGLPREVRLRDLPEAVHADICGAWQAKAESRVRQLAEASRIPERQVHLTLGEPVELLARFVGKGSGDLLVMGAVSRSKLRKVMIGHTAEKVLDVTDCDVVIVKLRPAAIRASSSARPRSPIGAS